MPKTETREWKQQMIKLCEPHHAEFRWKGQKIGKLGEEFLFVHTEMRGSHTLDAPGEFGE
jgi:hypothetical protein